MYGPGDESSTQKNSNGGPKDWTAGLQAGVLMQTPLLAGRCSDSSRAFLSLVPCLEIGTHHPDELYQHPEGKFIKQSKMTVRHTSETTLQM